MKSSYEVRARKFIAKIYPYIKDCQTVSEYELAVKRYNDNFSRKVCVNCGQTRVVLITSDYVVKVDYGTNSQRWGGCINEYRVYQQAVRDGYAYLFAKISPVMKADKVYYVMPRIHGIDCQRSEGYDVDEWLEGAEIDWLWEHVRDLHCQNYGWKNRKPVIVDYACEC